MLNRRGSCPCFADSAGGVEPFARKSSNKHNLRSAAQLRLAPSSRRPRCNALPDGDTRSNGLILRPAFIQEMLGINPLTEERPDQFHCKKRLLIRILRSPRVRCRRQDHLRSNRSVGFALRRCDTCGDKCPRRRQCCRGRSAQQQRGRKDTAIETDPGSICATPPIGTT